MYLNAAFGGRWCCISRRQFGTLSLGPSVSYFEGQAVLLFLTTPEWSQTRPDGYRWTTEDGHLLARTGGHLGTALVREQGMDRKMLDVLVMCWIAKL